MNGKEPFTEENDPGVGSAFYSCLTTKNQDSELAFSVAIGKHGGVEARSQSMAISHTVLILK